jgi:Family of unknown function (DUF6491)
MRVLTCAGLGLVTLMAGCAPTAGRGEGEAPRPARQCFSVQQVDNFRSGRIDQLFVRAGRSQVYELSVAGACRDLDFAYRLAITPDFTGAAGGRLCVGDPVRIVVPGDTSRTEVCRARIDRQLTEAEVEALPDAYRP